ncbi:MAG: molecular chaperone DnaJ [Thermodesulfobacteriota bacterium]
MEKDFYKILGVERNASDAEIKKAFRRLALKHHPDQQGGSGQGDEKFKEINEAYEVLKDPQKRAQYDRFGYAGTGTGGTGYRESGFGADFQDLFSEVFSDFFGGAGRPAAARGVDLKYDLDLSFEEAAFGTEKKVKIPRTVSCTVCGGSGARPGTGATTCPTCSGSGQVNFRQGFLSISRSCSNCRGTGSVIKNPCTGCMGSGKTRERGELSVKVPAGVDTGSRLRLVGEGDRGERGGPPGDLYIIVNIRPHPIFKRENENIICEVPISFPQAALGAEIEVPTLDGPAKLKVPAGTQSGKVFSLKGKGIASLHTGRRGEEFVVIRVETPAKLTKRQKELLKEFSEISGDETTPMARNFFDRVKDIFE